LATGLYHNGLEIMTSLLLVQIRPLDGEMARHEVDCIRRRLGDIEASINVRNVFAETPDIDWLQGQDAMVIGGSGAFSVHDPRSEEWVTELRHVLDACLERALPSLGICFGHQLLGLHLGVEVVTDLARREVGTLAFSLTEAGAKDPLFGTLGPEAGSVFRATTGHTDHVTRCPADTTLLATNETSPVQALKVNGAPFYSTQFHPDLNGGEARARYLSFAAGLPPEEQLELEEVMARFDPKVYPAEHLLARFVTEIVRA